LGFQSIAQVSGTYGRGTAETIVENCGNTLILRCSASERGGTSEFASKLIGQREVVHATHSSTRQPGKWLASTTTSEHLKIEPAVMASEIERLPDLQGFLKVASIPDWRSVKLAPMREPPPARPRRPVAETPITPDPEVRAADEPKTRRAKPRAAPTRAGPTKAARQPSARPRKTPAATPPEVETPTEDDAAIQRRTGATESGN
jgi:type IV secretory pathway TraG/TraD family ATPase VirD4